MTQTSEPIVVEQQFDQPAEEVWNAITQQEQMVRWFFDNIPDFQPVAGFQTEFVVDSGQRKFNHQWTITEATPPRKIVYDWRYEEFPGVGKVTFEVLDDGDSSRVRLTCEGVETFPQDIPEFSRESGLAGWTYFIQGNLKAYLDGAGGQGSTSG